VGVHAIDESTEAAGPGLIGEARPDRAGDASAEWQLRLVLDNVAEGVSLVDAEGRIILFNKRLPEILDLPESLLAGKPTQEEIVRFQVERGDLAEFGPDAAAQTERLAKMIREATGPIRYERAGRNGRVIEVMINPLTDGRQIRTFTDITQRKRAEEALAEQAALLQVTLEHMGDGIALFDSKLRLIVHNRAVLRYFDMSEEDLKKHPTADSIIRYRAMRGDYGPGDPEDHIRSNLESIHSREPHKLERALSDGTFVEIHHNPLADGRLVRRYSDITARRRAERRRKQSESLLRETLDNLDAEILVYDADDRFLLGNKRFHEFYPHYPPDEELRGKTFADLLRLSIAAGAVNDPEAMSDPDAYVARRVASRKSDPPVFEQLHSSGRWSFVRRHRTQSGLTIMLFFDITERKRIEEELAAKTALLQATLENMGDGIAVFDPDLKVLVHNGLMREYFGLPESLFEGEATAERLIRFLAEQGDYGGASPDDDFARVLQGFLATSASQHELALPNGRMIAVHHNPLPDGRLVRRYSDVTLRKRAEREIASKTTILQATLENMGDGIALFDPSLRLIVHNQTALRYFDMPEDALLKDPTAAGIIRYNAHRGDYGPGDPEDHVRRYLDSFRSQEPHKFEHQLSNGTIVEIHHNPLADGRIVRRYSDITARRRAEARRDESERLLRETLDNLDAEVVVYDAQGRFLLGNKRFHDHYPRYPADDTLRGKTFDDLMRLSKDAGTLGDAGAESDPENHLARLFASRTDDPPFYEQRHSSGRWSFVRRHRTQSGLTIILLFDITERKRIEEELASKSAVLTATLESIRDGISMLDENLNVVATNHLLEKTLRLPHDFFAELPQPVMRVLEYMADRGDYGPGDRSEALARRIAAFRVREPWTGELTLGDGRVIEIHHNPVADGRLLRSYADVTEQRRAQEMMRAAELRVRESEALLRETVDSLDASLVVYDAEDRYVLGNRRYHERYPYLPPGSELVGQTFEEMLRASLAAGRIESEEARENPERWLRRRLGQRGLNRDSTDIRRDPDGTWTLVKNATTESGNTVTLRIDITQQKRLEEELKVAKEAAEAATVAKSTFLANMSHEIRTPLNGVIANLELLGLTRIDTDQAELVGSAELAARALLNIIGEILDFSKIEASRLEIELVEVDPGRIVEEVTALLSTAARQKGVDLAHHVAADVPGLVLADPVRIRQVLLNLVGNALKFTQEGSVNVRLASEPDDEMAVLRFEVEDTGIGIDMEKAGDLFAPFVQADASTQRRFGGTGLGLAISHHLVQLMGGGIGYDGKPGIGSVFRFAVPVRIVDATASARRSPAEAGGRPVALPRFSSDLPILVVEDNQMNQVVARRQLRALGLDCVIAGDGRAGLAALDQGLYPLALLDLSMPEMDGFEMARLVREREKSRDDGFRLPIVALSANVAESEQSRALAAGMDAYLSKPVDLHRLAETLRRWIPMHGTAETPQPKPPPVEVEAPVDIAALMDGLGTEDPAEIAEVLGLFVSIMPGLVERMNAAFVNREPAALRDAAHAAKGAAGNARADRLAALYGDLQLAGHRSEWAEAERLLGDAARSYDDVAAFISIYTSEHRT